MLKQLNDVNRPEVTIYSAESSEIYRYGRLIEGIDFSDMCAHVMTSSDPEKTAYIRDLEILRDCDSFPEVHKRVYREKILLQTGLCFGMNSKMNGMEYHEGSEVIVALTDLVLILGRKEEIKDNSWDSSLAKCFLLPKGSALELYSGTLHLAPCRVTEKPFCSVIILPEGTNTPLDNKKTEENPLLFMNNKWLICHKESPAVSKGGFAGIRGENIQIYTI